jgi:acetylornithine/succinyldiaminopimelate/putrescine aminotransferase
MFVPMPDTQDIIHLERFFLLQTYNRYPVIMERGKGVFLYDLEGKKYLDFVAGLGVMPSAMLIRGLSKRFANSRPR